MNQVISSIDNRNDNPINTPKYISAPYIPQTSERINRILKDHDIKLSNKASNTLFNKLSNVKQKRTKLEKTGAIYKINCKDCNDVYIGETGKQLKERVKQHEAAVRNNNIAYQVVQHCNDNNHTMDFDNVQIVNQNTNVRSRRFLEAFYSACNTNSFNRRMNFSDCYVPLLQDIIGNSN